MKTKNKATANFLEKIPVRADKIGFSTDQNKLVTLEVENVGVMNKIAQKLLKKPRHSYIHLDENGSFVWLQIDGESDILKIGEQVKEHFGEKAEPLYPRLLEFIRILENYKFITYK